MNDNTIILVDSDEELQNALGIYLVRLGYHVIKKQSGRSCLDSIHEGQPLCIITGTKLVDIKVDVFIRTIRHDNPEIEVIVIIEKAERKIGIECLRLDASDYIVKPINSEQLEITLNRALSRRETWLKLKNYEEQVELADHNKAVFQKLFDEVPCYISLQDKNFRLTGANRRFKKDFGDRIGSYCYEIYKHRTDPCHGCPVEATFEDGEPHQTEEVVTSQYGQQYNVLTWTAPIRDESGEISQVMEMSTNITQIRKLQSHLTSLGLLLSSMSHGVRGLLTALDGGIYRLETGIEKGDNQKIREGIVVVKKMAYRIRRMVLDILYYTKERELNWEPVDIIEFSNQLIEAIKPKVETYRIDFDWEIDQSLGSLEIDPEVVNAALLNILENSVDACLDDKSKNKTHKIIFRVIESEDRIIFEITDNGHGMDRYTRENLFTLFFSSKGHRGTGLGLYIANQIIEQHSGTIEVESERGEGACFRIKLFKILPDEAKNGQIERNIAVNSI